MKKIYLASVLVLLSVNVSLAQVKFGIKGGLDLANVTLDGNVTSNLSADNTTGFFIGPTLDFKIPILQLGVDASLMYNQKKIDVNGESESAHYVNIPINAKMAFGLGDIVGVYVATGPQFAFCIGDDTFNFKDIEGTAANFALSKSQFSWNIGAGVKLLKHLQVGYNYNIAFGSTGDFDYKDAAGKAVKGELNNNSHQVTVAYLF